MAQYRGDQVYADDVAGPGKRGASLLSRFSTLKGRVGKKKPATAK